VTVYLAHTLQVGANTFALNADPTAAIVANSTVANLTRGYVAGSFIKMCTNGSGGWFDMSQ
jgi:hypothetical protein